MKDLSFVAINKKIPVVLSNMIRHIDGNESENMSSAISLYTHVKVRFSKTQSKYLAETQLLLNKSKFEYRIGPSGLTA